MSHRALQLKFIFWGNSEIAVIVAFLKFKIVQKFQNYSKYDDIPVSHFQTAECSHVLSQQLYDATLCLLNAFNSSEQEVGFNDC